MQWTLVVPLKPLARAKSRLSDTAADGLRPGLALAFALDTVAAALACPAVKDVAVVTGDALAGRELGALGAHIVGDEPGGGLNAALAHAAGVVRTSRPETPVAALNADLPALRPLELARVLDAAAEFPRAFLPDAAEIGTTLLAASPAMNCARHSARIPAPVIARPVRWNCSSTRWIPCARTWTPVRICAPHWSWAWARVQRRWRHGC